jgi:hypothetical protein
MDVIITNYNPELHETPAFSGFTDEERFDFTESEREKAELAVLSTSLKDLKKKVKINVLTLVYC